MAAITRGIPCCVRKGNDIGDASDERVIWITAGMWNDLNRKSTAISKRESQLQT